MLDRTASDIQYTTYTFAHGEGKIPVFSDPIAENLSFPTVFCGKVIPSNHERLLKVYESEIFKYELFVADTHVAVNIQNITT